MARKVKIPNHIKKRHSQKPAERIVATRNERRYYLIVCEGEKTEPNYFISLKDNLPKGVLNVYDFRIVGTGHNTTSLLKKAIELKNELQEATNRTIDKLWIVMDKDSFKPASFNAAITQCIENNPDTDCAWSNEAFELWYLLHFNYYDTAMNREQYKALIEQNFRAKGLEGYTYKKNSIEMYGLLEKYGSTTTAIRNAETLATNFTGRTDYANHNPCTMVYRLVRELLELG